MSIAFRIFSSLAAVLAAAMVLVACGDDEPPSSTTGAKPATGVPGVAANSVLEFEGRRYLLVSLVPGGDAELDDAAEIGTGVVRSSAGDTEVPVYRRDDVGDDDSLYTTAPQPQQGGADVSNQLYHWKSEDETNEITPPARNDADQGDDDDDGLAP